VIETTDNVDLYHDLRTRVSGLLREPGVDGDAIVPCCPNWTVTQVVAHFTGVCTDILAGQIAEAGQDSWTAAQVDARAGRSLDEVLAEWDDVAPTVEDLLKGGLAPDQWIFDSANHEHDVRGAIGRPGARDDAAVSVGNRFILDALGAGFPASIPSLRIVSDPFDRVVGGGQPEATLTAEPFELLRAVSGRRSRAQIEDLDWGGADPTPWLPLFTFGPFTPSATDILE
jgi:uncharacterized protein (TIGR03083 family)